MDLIGIVRGHERGDKGSHRDNNDKKKSYNATLMAE
jgi:hypothetical protein